MTIAAASPLTLSKAATAPVNARAAAICAALKKAGITHVVWLPDSETHFMHAALVQDPGLTVVQACREGETIAICAGLHIGGARAALLVENQGLFECGNVLKWAKNLGFPIVMLVGFLFYAKMERDADGNMSAGGVPDFTERFLDAFAIERWLVDSDDDVTLVDEACATAYDKSTPVAVLLTKADDYESGN